MRKHRIALIGLGLFALAACSSGAKYPAGALNVTGETSKRGAFLAYEHTVQIQTSAENVSSRMMAVRSACEEGRFGACTLLRFNQSNAQYVSGSATVRIVPVGVEPLVQLAGEGGAIGSRETKAEDRAEAVADITQKTELLNRQRAKLSEFQTRKDLPVSDGLALTRELTAIELQLDELAKAEKNEQRRIETNLLTLNFRVDKEESKWSRITAAFGGILTQLADGIAQTIEIFAYGLPMLLVAFPLALLWRWLWRRVTHKRKLDRLEDIELAELVRERAKERRNKVTLDEL